MIAYLRGAIIHKAFNYLVLETGGLGYKIYASPNLINDLKAGAEAEIYTYHVVREDTSDLYGFKSFADLELFEMLLTVSGIGPKSAASILATASPSDVKEAIMRGDSNLLTKVSGVGKKTAERVVLELKGKIAKLGSDLDLSFSSGLLAGDELEALMTLGFSLASAREALNAVAPEIKDSGERIKEALKNITKN